jgi:hypothetical protein
MKPKPPPPLPTGLYWESALAEHFGISRTRMRELRHSELTAADWRIEGNAVVLTAQGRAKIASVLGRADAARPADRPAASPRDPAPPDLREGPPEIRRFMIVRLPRYPTHYKPEQKQHLIVRACAPDQPQVKLWSLDRVALSGLELTLRVPRSDRYANFAPGMVLDGVRCGPGMWQLRGRLPRRPGHW